MKKVVQNSSRSSKKVERGLGFGEVSRAFEAVMSCFSFSMKQVRVHEIDRVWVQSRDTVRLSDIDHFMVRDSCIRGAILM